MATITHQGLTFEIVDTAPLGYDIWNIGKNMVEGYLPFCRLSTHQPFPGATNIETDTLKAVKCEGAQIILAAIGRGPKTIKEMEAYIAKNRNAKPGTCAYTQIERYMAALPYMRQLRCA